MTLAQRRGIARVSMAEYPLDFNPKGRGNVLQRQRRESFTRSMERYVQRIQEPAGTRQSRSYKPPRADEAGPVDRRRHADREERAEFAGMGGHMGQRQV